jgi:hypothetical protein
LERKINVQFIDDGVILYGQPAQHNQAKINSFPTSTNKKASDFQQYHSITRGEERKMLEVGTSLKKPMRVAGIIFNKLIQLMYCTRLREWFSFTEIVMTVIMFWAP